MPFLTVDQRFDYMEGDLLALRGCGRTVRVVYVDTVTVTAFESIIGEKEYDCEIYARLLGFRNWKEMSGVFFDRYGTCVRCMLLRWEPAQKKVRWHSPRTGERVWIPGVGSYSICDYEYVLPDNKYTSIANIKVYDLYTDKEKFRNYIKREK
jgi:hypothetical protein